MKFCEVREIIEHIQKAEKDRERIEKLIQDGIFHLERSTSSEDSKFWEDTVNKLKMFFNMYEELIRSDKDFLKGATIEGGE